MNMLKTMTLADAVYEKIKEKIISHELRPGSQVLQKSLSREFGVSSTPVRDALRKLEQEGLVVNSRKRMASVIEIDADSIADLNDLREAIETLAVRKLASNMTQEDLLDLRELAAEADKQYLEAEPAVVRAGQMADLAFHELLVTRSGNRWITQFAKTFNVCRQIILTSFAMQKYRPFSHDPQFLHMELFAALEKGDGELARQKMRGHLDNSKKHMLEFYARMNEAR